MTASDVLNRLTEHRTRQAPLVSYVEPRDTVMGNKLRHCGSWLHLREWLQSGESRVMNANFCKATLLCRSCAARRAGKLIEGYGPKVEALTAQRPSLVPAMVTLTVKNGEDLKERYEHLKASWKRMTAAQRKADSNPVKNTPIEWNKVQGAVRSIEITRGKGGWHPHIHAYCLLDQYINPFHLSAEWERFTGDSYVVDVRECKNGILPALCEVLKYTTKFSELDPSESWEIHSKLAGSRFIDPSGILRGVKTGDLDSDDISGLEGPYRDFIATWLGNGYRLREADTLPVSTSNGAVMVVKESCSNLIIERPNKK